MKDSFFSSCFCIIFSFFALNVLASEPITEPAFSPTFPGDCQKYDTTHYLELTNGLKVLLVSDMTANKAKALLDVDVGYRDDPKDILGMAHFLEHMLFQGTLNNPENNAYKEFLMAHGGDSNASTSYLWTNYHFDIDPEFFDPALSMFSDQFKIPLFSEEFIDKEKSIIHAEFNYRKDSLYRKQFSVAQNTLFENHPLENFGTGNDSSLSKYDKPTLAKKMREWWKANYSSEKMSLVLYGPLSIEKLQEMANKYFSNIPVFKGRSSHNLASFNTDGKLPQIARTVIDEDERAMLLLFPIHNFNKSDNAASARFIESLLEKAVPGSFVNYLKGYRFASSISAEVVSIDEVTYLEVYIDLWYKGGEKYWDVIKGLFYYVDKLKNEAMEQWRIDEFNLSQALKWCYEEGVDLETYARNLNITHAKNVFSHNKIETQINTHVYKSILDAIRVDNMFAVIVYPHFSVDKETPWFEIEYSLESLTESDFKNFQPDPKKNLYMERPQLNPYLPSEMIILKDLKREPPEKLDFQENFNAWYQKDFSFKDARSYFYLDLSAYVIDESKKSSAVANLLVEILEEQLKYLDSSAEDANNDLTIKKVRNGIGIYFEGYPEAIDKLIDQVLSKLNDFKIRKDLFEGYRYGWMNYLKKPEEIHPLNQSDEMQKQLIKGPGYSYSEQYAGIRGARKSYVFNLLNDLKDNLSVTSLSYGNVTREQANAWNKKVQDALVKQLKPHQNYNVATKLPSGITRVTQETDYDDSVTELYVQGHNDSDAEKAKFRLLHYLMSEKFFSELRTEKNLGYVINARALRYENVPGFNFRIQSPYKSPDQLETSIIQFLGSYALTLDKMDIKEFQAAKDALMTELRKDPDTSGAFASRAWKAIRIEHNNFDYSLAQLKAIENYSKSEFAEWYNDRFLSLSKKLLSVMVKGESHEFSDDWEDLVEDTIIDDFEDFIEAQAEKQ